MKILPHPDGLFLLEKGYDIRAESMYKLLHNKLKLKRVSKNLSEICERGRGDEARE